MLIIGIAGGTGSGKTTVVNQIVEELPEAQLAVITQDSYYKDTSDLTYEERTKINFDHPSSIDFPLMIEHIRSLRDGNTIQQPVYSFKEHNRTGESVPIKPKPVVIVEGILVLTLQELRDLFDIKIYVDTDSDERLIRRLKRDICERGRDLNEVLDRYQNTLKPMHQQFIEPSKSYADIIIPTHRHNSVAVDIVRTIINERIG